MFVSIDYLNKYSFVCCNLRSFLSSFFYTSVLGASKTHCVDFSFFFFLFSLNVNINENKLCSFNAFPLLCSSFFGDGLCSNARNIAETCYLRYSFCDLGNAKHVNGSLLTVKYLSVRVYLYVQLL